MKYKYTKEEMYYIIDIMKPYCASCDVPIDRLKRVIQHSYYNFEDSDRDTVISNLSVLHLIECLVETMLADNVRTFASDLNREELRPLVLSIYEQFVFTIKDVRGYSTLYETFINSEVSLQDATNILKNLDRHYELLSDVANCGKNPRLKFMLSALDGVIDLTIFDIINVATPMLISDEFPQSSTWLSDSFKAYIPRLFGYPMSGIDQHFRDNGTAIPEMELEMLSPYYDINSLLFAQHKMKKCHLSDINYEALQFSPNIKNVIRTYFPAQSDYVHDVLSEETKSLFLVGEHLNHDSSSKLSLITGRELMYRVPKITVDGSKLNVKPTYEAVYLSGLRNYKKDTSYFNEKAEKEQDIKTSLDCLIEHSKKYVGITSQEMRGETPNTSDQTSGLEVPISSVF